MCARSIFGFLLLLALGLTSEITSAQAQAVSPGFEIGISTVSLSYDAGPPFYEKVLIPEWNAHPRLSFSAMAFLEIPLGSSWSLQSGLRFSQVGDKTSYSDSAFDFAREKRQQYLSVPVRLRYNIFDSPIYAIAGPEFGYLLRAVSTYETSFLNPGHPSDDENFSEYLKRTNVTIGFGIGITFPFLGRRMYLQVYHNEGATGNIRKPEDQGFAVRRIGGYDWTTREIILNAGYLF